MTAAPPPVRCGLCRRQVRRFYQTRDGVPLLRRACPHNRLDLVAADLPPDVVRELRREERRLRAAFADGPTTGGRAA